MKTLIILCAAIGIITLTAITIKPSWSNEKAGNSGLNTEKYKVCIEACNTCITSCKKVKQICKKNEAMAECEKLTKECITACSDAVRFMSANSILAKSKCLECAVTTENYAIECDKFDFPDCKKCAIDCRKTANVCNQTSKHNY